MEYEDAWQKGSSDAENNIYENPYDRETEYDDWSDYEQAHAICLMYMTRQSGDNSWYQ